MPVYFIRQDDLVEGRVRLASDLAHHLARVLRYQIGDEVALVDETGKKYGAQIVSISPKGVALRLLWEARRAEPPRCSLHLGVACLQGSRLEWVIEKAVELGALRISPLITRRVVVKVRADRLDHQQRRWMEIAKEAAQQSERWEIPQVEVPQTLDSFLEQTEAYPLKFIFWEKEASACSLSAMITQSALKPAMSGPVPVAALIGPEGGWEKDEVDRAKEYGYCSVSLGDRPLRADTAAVAAMTLLQYEFQNG